MKLQFKIMVRSSAALYNMNIMITCSYNMSSVSQLVIVIAN